MTIFHPIPLWVRVFFCLFVYYTSLYDGSGEYSAVQPIAGQTKMLLVLIFFYNSTTVGAIKHYTAIFMIKYS